MLDEKIQACGNYSTVAPTPTPTLTLALALAPTLTRLERLPCSSAPKKPAEELSQLPRADGARPRPDP